MNAVPLCLGLHISKCAGTSLMTTLRRLLTEDEHYFFSSYHEAWLASRPLLGELTSRARLRIVFGHYCHETLLSVFADRPIFLFTGLREPVACAVSLWRHSNAVRVRAGREPLGAAAFLAANPNPICTEILRAFPTIAAGPGAPWERARAALSLFDYLYATERFATDAATIFAVLDVQPAALAQDNVATRSDDGTALRAAAGAHLAEDLRLYAAMQPWLGRAWVRTDMAREGWAADRAAFLAALPGPAAALAIFSARERDFLAAEFDDLGRAAALRESLQARIRAAAALLDRLG